MPDTPQQFRGAYEAALEKTARAEDFSPEGVRREIEATAPEQLLQQTASQYLRRTATDRTDVDPTETHELTRLNETRDLPSALADDSRSGPRFEVRSEVGSGATSRVYAVHDHSLKRTVAVKLLRRSMEHKSGARSRFIQEARMTAMLEHPNIVPVHDIGLTGDEQVFLAMKNVSGCSMGDAIRAACGGEKVPEEFSSTDGIVRVFLKVCDALSYAHHAGFIHQDVKPDNIMLGEFGEVLLLDWGSARSKEDGGQKGTQGLFGTPAYMSPEQARREGADERSDVYCVGATLFHALLLRHPVWDDDPDRFWEKKRAGTLDGPTPEERRRVPAPLLDIALKALAAESRGRYQTMGELAADLKNYQAGLAVKAHRETLLERFVRWYKHNRRVFWISAIATGLVLSTASMLLGEKVKEWVTWRHFHTENFSYRTSEDLAANWRCLVSFNWWDLTEQPFSDTSAWHLKDGAAEGVFGFGFTNLTFAQQVPGDMRVEWTVTPLRMGINPNCYIAGGDRKSGYTFHVGGFGDPGSVALTRLENFQPLVRARLQPPLEAGKACRLRMEKEGRHVRFFQNGRKLIDYVDMDDLSGRGHQTFGFEDCFHNTIRIDNVVVYYHPLPRKVSPLAVADRFFQKGYFADATDQFAEVAESYPGSDLAGTALYRKALCLARLDSAAAALSVLWTFEREFPRHELVPAAGYERSRLLEAQGDTVASHETLRSLAARFPGHPVLAAALNDMTARRLPQMHQVLNSWNYAFAPPSDKLAWMEHESRNLQQWGRLFAVPIEGNDFLVSACYELGNSRAYPIERLAAVFPEQRGVMCRLFFELPDGPERILRDYPDLILDRCRALCNQGRYSEALRVGAINRNYSAIALFQLGRFADVVRFYPDQPDWCPPALVAQAKLEQAMADHPEQARNLFARLGRSAELLPMLQGRPDVFCTFLNGVGRADSSLAIIKRTPPVSDMSYLLPHLLALDGAGRFGEAADSFAWYNELIIARADEYCRDGRPRELFVRFPARPDVQAVAYGELGLFDSALVTSAANRAEHHRVLWRTDQRDQMLVRWPERRNLAAVVRLTQGRYEEVLQSYSEQRRPAALALYHLGRYEDVLSRFGDQRDLAAYSLLALGQEAELLKRYPDCRPEYADWLIAQGRLDDVVHMFPDQVYQYCQALALLGRIGEAPLHTGLVRPTLQQACEVQALAALQAFRSGRPRIADSLFAAMESAPFGYTWWPQRFPRFLLRPALYALAGDSGRTRRSCEAVADWQRKLFSQRLGFEVRLLDGSIDTAQFLGQPCRYLVRERLALMKAVMDDAVGRQPQALAGYRAILADQRCALPDYQMGALMPMALFELELGTLRAVDDVFASPTLREFVRWRVRELGAKQG